MGHSFPLSCSESHLPYRMKSGLMVCALVLLLSLDMSSAWFKRVARRRNIDDTQMLEMAIGNTLRRAIRKRIQAANDYGNDYSFDFAKILPIAKSAAPILLEALNKVADEQNMPMLKTVGKALNGALAAL